MEAVTEHLKRMGLANSFEIRPVARGSHLYRVLVKASEGSPEVDMQFLGFGLSQVLPVITSCYVLPSGTSLIIEQPELHLHPKAQSELADVFINAVNRRQIQVIFESHSEHLLTRLQRRVAEGLLRRTDVALYFTQLVNGVSRISELKLDEGGNIVNWPDDFFGDELGERLAMAEAAAKSSIT
jgi:predicted ATPase